MGDAARIGTRSFYLPGIDFTLTINPETIVMTWMAIFIILALTFLFTRKLENIPNKRQTALELLIGWFDGILKESMGSEGRSFLPLILTLFLFVLISNWLAVIPKLSAATKDLNTCLALGMLVFFISYTAAMRKKGIRAYLANYLKPYWFLLPSNIFSELSKVLSHSFRLFGNIFAGGVVISVVPVILVQLFKWFGIPLGLVAMPVITVFFGFFIGGIQAFVFAILAVAYITVLRE